MKAISLFSGIGGIDLGFERAGIYTVLQAEHDRWCSEVLAHHWPAVERISDVRSVDGGVWERSVGRARGGTTDYAAEQRSRSCPDVVFGGFPCQPFSSSGLRKGQSDDRYLWPEYRRIVSELRPRWVVIENVIGLLSIDGGRLFGGILDDLDDLGFDAAWSVLDSRHFGVPQRRRRVFVVAGPRGRGAEQVLGICEACGGVSEEVGGPEEVYPGAVAVRLAQTSSNGWGVGLDGLAYTLDGAQGQGVITDGLLRRFTPRECERLHGFPDDWTAVAPETARYAQMGNAVSPPVAEWIGHRLVAVDAMLGSRS